jgi:predicted nucleotidyltransferase
MENKAINLQLVRQVALGLEEINEHAVFVGGAVVSLYADDDAAEEVRPTDDIDFTIQLTSYVDFIRLSEQLNSKGFAPNPAGHSICSFLYKNISIDIMPASDTEIGPANKWFTIGFDYLKTINHQECNIRIFSLPVFLASKFEAFKNRGNDYRTSHDFEDIIYVIDNSLTVIDEIQSAPSEIKLFIKDELLKVVNNKNYKEIVASQLHPNSIATRLPIILNKIETIVNSIY